jgi:type VI protein secretion system component VasA
MKTSFNQFRELREKLKCCNRHLQRTCSDGHLGTELKRNQARMQTGHRIEDTDPLWPPRRNRVVRFAVGTIADATGLPGAVARAPASHRT